METSVIEVTRLIDSSNVRFVSSLRERSVSFESSLRKNYVSVKTSVIEAMVTFNCHAKNAVIQDVSQENSRDKNSMRGEESLYVLR